MKRRDAWIRAALLSIAVLHVGSCTAPKEVSLCDDAPGARKVSGSITRGKSSEKVMAPVTLEGALNAEPFIDYLTVGGTRAENKGTNFSLWSAQLTQADLEANRDGNDARIQVVAVDVCGDAHAIDETRLPIGPSTKATVTGLDLQITEPMGECYLPASGSAAAAVKVLADGAFAGVDVMLTASQGTFSAPGQPLKLTLVEDGDMASQQVYFESMTPGTALLTVTAQGASKGPLAIPIAAAPKVSSEGAKIDRGAPFSVYVSTRGNLATCRAEASYPGSVTVTIADPAIGAIDGETSVKEAMPDCAEPELLRVEVLFDASAPDSALVTLRCSDSFGQEGSATIGIAVPLPDAGL